MLPSRNHKEDNIKPHPCVVGEAGRRKHAVEMMQKNSCRRKRKTHLDKMPEVWEISEEHQAGVVGVDGVGAVGVMGGAEG